MSGNTYKVLFTGDISYKIEKLLINKYKNNLKSDILIVPHHGSITSSSEEFIGVVNPQYAIISAGYMNRYNHPHQKILHRYTNLGIKILNTITNGSINFKLFGNFKQGSLKHATKVFDIIQYDYYRINTSDFWIY